MFHNVLHTKRLGSAVVGGAQLPQRRRRERAWHDAHHERNEHRYPALSILGYSNLCLSLGINESPVSTRDKLVYAMIAPFLAVVPGDGPVPGVFVVMVS